MIKNYKKDIIVTICAKGNSKGLINKNILDYFGKPLLYYAYKKAKQNKLPYICLSTESEKVQKIANSFGLKSFFLRSKKLCKPNVAKEKVWKDAVIKSQIFYKKNFKYMLDIEITNPILSSKDLRIFLNNFFSKGLYKKKNGQFYISNSRKSPYFNILRKKKSGYEVCIMKKNSKIFSRQKSPKTFEHVAGFYLFKTDYLLKLKKENIFSDKIIGLEIPFYKTFDIDTLEDFKLSKTLFENYK